MSHEQVCVVYVVKRKCHSRRLSQLMGMACNKTHARGLQTSRKKIAVDYEENSCSRCYNYIL